MDTGRLKRFATEARTILMQGVKHRLQAMGFDLKTGEPVEMPQAMEGGAVFMGDIVSMDFYKKWMSLYNNIKSRTIKNVAEEAAYTWFNRFMAIRIMAKQEFIAPVLAYESEDIRVPFIVSEARQGRMPQMSNAQRTLLLDLLNDDSKTSEQFAILIVAYCHENHIINKCFGAIADYTELLLPQNILNDGGFIDMINHTEFITDEQYASAELIGWLYQFYISDRKDEAFAKKGKYDPDEIAPATQIFTPNWIVKYMAENTLGRIYIDNNPYCKLKGDLKYLVDVQPSSEPLKIDDLAQLKCADLACGSGHILNECFDLLYKIYIEEGYTRTQAIKDILCKNILGIDLDTRAKQLATFALLMKACQKDNSFLDGNVMPRVYNMPRPIAGNIPADSDYDDPKSFLYESIPHYMMGCNDVMTQEIVEAILLMNHADTLGSIMKFDISEQTRNAIMVRTQEYEEQLVNGEIVPETIQIFIPYMNIILALTEKYATICMNPPYMGSGRFDNVLSKYVKDNYPRSKADLMSVFMDVAIDRLMPNGKYGMINMHSWMFLSSFEELRRNLLDTQTIDSLLHLGPRTFDELSGEVVQNASFVITNCKTEDAKGTYFRLVDGKNCLSKSEMFIDAKNNNTENVIFSNIVQDEFNVIPCCPLGYWITSSMKSAFKLGNLISEYALSNGQNITGDNKKYIRLFWEVNAKTVNTNYWALCARGGGFRRYFGNVDNVILWSDEAKNHYHKDPIARIIPDFLQFKEGITWSYICSGHPSFRKLHRSETFEKAGTSIFVTDEDKLESILAFLNSQVACAMFKVIAPTLNFQVRDVFSLPLSDEIFNSQIGIILSSSYNISKQDWDSHETSWDFQRNPLCEIAATAGHSTYKLEALMNLFEAEQEENFRQLHHNEEELNRQFIEIYGLQDELTPDVAPEDITILQQGEISFEDGTGVKEEDSYLVIHNRKLVWHYDVLMKQLISYAVGCMMGRYSIDKPGLILANQGDTLKEFQQKVSNSRFEVDDDGIIPLMTSDTDFADNATVRFKQWLSVTFGSETLVDNLNYIEAALGKSIDAYFVKDFWKDHKKMYQNRPIYWLFSSKKGVFQCIAYMHRMDAYTAERIRTKYLLPHIEWLVQKQSEMEANAANLSTAERKKLDNIRKQIDECREYHDRLHMVADEQIAFDLDDGVVVNYAKFGDVLQKIK